jgi:hypothetical protein
MLLSARAAFQKPFKQYRGPDLFMPKMHAFLSKYVHSAEPTLQILSSQNAADRIRTCK